MNWAKAVRIEETSLEGCERYLKTHYPRQRRFATTPEALRAAHAVAVEAYRVRVIRLAMSGSDQG